jgi:hypothetical protein
LQTDPADVFRALKAFRRSGHPPLTLVKGRRRGRRLSERLISMGMGILASSIFRMRLSEINAQPKVFHRNLIAHMNRPPIDFNFDVYVLVVAQQNGWRIDTIPVQFPPRQYGHSNWARTWRSKIRTIWRSVKYMLGEAIGRDSNWIEPVNAEGRAQKTENQIANVASESGCTSATAKTPLAA